SPQDRALAAWQGRVGMAHLLQGRPSEAIQWLHKARGGYANRSGGEPAYVYGWLAAAYALTGEIAVARTELEQGWLRGFHRSLTALERDRWYEHPKTRALAEATYFAGLRKAGMPEE